MSICNMVRGSQEHSDRQQAHLLMPLPVYKWTGGTADEEEQSEERPRNQGPEQSTGAAQKNMYLLQLGMWVFLLCV